MLVSLLLSNIFIPNESLAKHKFKKKFVFFSIINFMNKKTLGKTEITVTPVGMGVLTVGKTQLNLPVEKGAELIRHALDRGINFLDTAEYYETYKYIQSALSSSKHEAVISSKSLSCDYFGMQNAIEEARKALNRDVIDIFLLHEVRSQMDFISRVGAWECLNDYKAKNILKAIGLSTHHIDVTEYAANIKDLDIVFTLTNFKSLGIRKNDTFGSKEEMACAIKTLSEAQKGVFTMKTFGGGNLTSDYIKALDYANSIEGVDSIMIGMGSIADIDNAVDYFENRLSEDFVPDVTKKIMRIDQGDCEACYACIKKCPNKAIQINNAGLAEIDPKTCITCGYCAPVCPVRAIIMY